MTTPAGIQHKIRQLDNDVQAIYERLTGIQATQQRQGNRLEEIAATQAEQTAVLTEHTAVLTEHTAVLTEHTAVLTEHTAVLTEHTAVLTGHGTKLDTILDVLRAGGPGSH